MRSIKIKCINNNEGSLFLTEGKIYNAKSDDDGQSYYIMNDDSFESYYSGNRFIVVKEDYYEIY